MPAYEDAVAHASEVDSAVQTAGLPVFSLWGAILLVFAAGDAFFITLHLLFEFQLTKDPVFSLEGDRVAGEFWQYVKEYWIVLAMCVLLWVRRQPVYAVWGLVFAYLLADDALEIHEKTGAKIGTALNLTAIGNLQSWDQGQIIFAAACGAVVLGAMALFYRKGDKAARRVTRRLLGGLVLMGLFGVGCDALHALTALDAMIVVEEGGELFIMSGICTLMICEVLRDGTITARLRARGSTLRLTVDSVAHRAGGRSAHVR